MNPDIPNQNPKKPEEPEKIEGRVEEKNEGLYSYAKSNTRDTVAYLVLIIGVVLLFFHMFIGSF